jgi:transposase
LRDLTRYRTKLGDDRKSEINRLHKVLEDANLKLTSVVSDVMGVTAQAILAELVKGNTDAVLLADLAKGRLREKQDRLRQALVGNLKAHHRFMLAQHLSHIEFLDEAIAQLDAQIAELLRPFEAELAAWDSLPGINRRIGEIVIAEVGPDLQPFADAHQLASWAGMCPGNDQSGGKRKNAKTRKGSKWLRRALIEAAHGAARKKKSYYQGLYHRSAARRGKQRAAVAVGHSLLVAGYYLITRHQMYEDLGDNYFDQRDREQVKRRAVKRLEKLGFQVHLTPATASAL